MNYTKEEIEQYDKQSLENLIAFYRLELIKIEGGQKAYNLLPNGVRKRFVENGVFINRYGDKSHNSKGKGCTQSLSLMAIEILKGIR